MGPSPRASAGAQIGGGIDADWTTEEITKYVMAGMRSIGHVLTWQACVDRFGIDDGILTSINEAEAEYTKALKERVFVRDETRVRRYRVLEDAPLPNGRIVISDTAPFPQCVKSKDTEVAPLPPEKRES